MIRRLSLVLALGAVSVLAACGSNEPPSPDPAIGITAPQDAAAFSDDDDVDPTTDGVQIAVTVSVENFVTTHEVFLSSSGDVGGTQSLPLLGVDDPGEVTFDTVTLAAGTNTLTATLFGNDEDIAVAAITVTLSDDGVTPSIAITTPPNGTTLGADDDLDPAVDGVQVAVEAATQNIAGGTAVSVAVNGSEAATANVDGDGVRFGSVTLVEGQNAVRVATEVDGTAISDEITVTVATGACTVTVSPGPEADACEVVAETPDADPDTDGVQVELTIGSDCADLVVTLDGEQVAAATTADGEATVVVTFAEGENTLEVTASDDGQEGTSGVLAYTTDTVAPSLALDSSFAGVVTPDADVDLDTDGLQIDIFGTSDLPIGAEVALSIDGVAVATTAVAEGGVWTFDDVTFASSGAYLVQASALDECGNSGETEERDLRVFVIPPTLAIVAPEDGATWNAGDDSDPEADLIQGTFELAGEFAEGTEARVECRPADAPPGSPFAPVAEGAFGDAGTAAVMATLADNVWLCRGLVESPLRAATAPIRLTVDSMVPAPEIRRPLPGALLASTTVVLSVVVGQVTEGEELAVTYTVGDEDPVTVELVDAGFEADVTVSEGEVTITVDVVDGAGNAGSASVSFTVDITGPSLTPVFPVADAIILEDELTADLLLDARFDVDGVDEASELCVSINGMVPDCVGDLAVGEVTVSGVAVLPGDNTLDARLTDAAGNDAELSFGFTVDVDLPRLVIATPVDGSAVNEADGHEVLLNSDLAEGVDITLWVNDAAFGTMASDDVGSAIFTGVSFVEGPNTLYASATDDRGTGTSLTTNVLLDTVPPELAFASPEEGTIFNAESPDASGAAGFQTTASVTGVDLADGRPVTLDVDCDGELSTHEAFFVGGSAEFTAVGLADVATCALSATAVDETGNEGTATVTVVVDRARPRITWLRPTSDLAITDDSSDAPGIQSFLVLSVEDGSDGQTVTIRQESAALDEPTVVETDPLSGLLVYVDEYPLSDGVVTLTAWTSDDAGNRSLDTAVSFTVASDLAGALLSDPGSGSSVNLDDDISGVPGIQMNVRANVFGAFDEHDAHLCIASEDAGTYPEPCDSVGFRRMASAVVAANEAVFPSVSLPDGRITLLVEIVLGDGTVVPPFAPTLVLVDSVAPILEGFEVLGDTNEDGYLNGDESDTDSLPASTSLRANFFGIEDGRTARVTTDNPAPGTLLGTGDVVGGTVLVPVEFNQGTHTLEVSVSDLAGNEVAEGAPSIALIVDTIGPTVEVAAPGAGARLLAEDDLNIEPSDGLQYEVVVTTDAMTGSTVALSSDGDGGARDIGELTVGDGRAAGTETLPEGANTITAQVSDTAGNLGSDMNDFFVDSMPPSIAFTAPVGPTAVSSGDDLELGTGGIQIDVAVSTEDAEVGQPIVIRSLLSGALVSDGVTVAGAGAQTVRVTLRAPGVHTLEASVTDINGNVATADSTTITLTLEGCAILFVDLDPVMTYFNAADDSDGDPDNGIDVDIPVVVADGACVGETASLHLDGGGAPIATATIGADLTTTFTAVHFSHGDAGTLEAEVTHDGALSSTGEFSFAIDLIAPSIDAITPGTGDPVPVGSAQASAVSGDGFVDFALDTTGAVGGTLAINEDAALLADVAVDADTVVAAGVAFAAGSHTLVFTLHDAAGNSTTATRNYLVDWTQPDVTDFLIELLNRRSGETSLSWRFDGDATRYEIRAALIEIDDATWDNPAVSTLATVSVVSGVGVDELLEHHIDSLAFQQRHYLAMRAVDEVGNESPVAGGNVFVGMLSIDLATTAAAVDDAASIGDVNNDGYADAIISGANAPLQVFYGAENIEDGFITPIAPPAGSSFFGISAHGVGDVNGDGLPDVMVGAPLTAPRGTAYLYFGRDGSPLPADPDVTFDYSSPSASPFFGYSLTDGGGDVTRLAGEAPGDVIDDLVIAAIAEGDGGAAYVIAGRETWPATFTVSNDPEVNHAQGVATITGVSAGARFGRSIAIPGDVDMSADGLADFVIGAYSATTLATGETYYFYGRPMADFPSTGLGADDADERVLGPFGATFWVADGIGVLPDVDGDGAPEWMLWDRNRDAVDVFLGGDPPPTAATYRYTGTIPEGLDVDFGRQASSAGDVDTLNGHDVLVRVSRGIGSSDDGHFAVLLNDGTGDFRLGEALAFIDVDGGRPTGVGDLNNDGFADFIVVIPGALSDIDLRIYY